MMNTKKRGPTMTFDYFAYGSNMLTERLTQRGLNPTKPRRAYANDRIIEFSKLSKDCSGKATLRLRVGHRTPGVLFRIPITELCILDSFEDAGKGYFRCNHFPVHLSKNDEIVCAKTYLAACHYLNLEPYDWYLALVIAGVLKQCLGANHLTMLRGMSYYPDIDYDRKGRRDAIKVLCDAGFPDYQSLLGSD